MAPAKRFSRLSLALSEIISQTFSKPRTIFNKTKINKFPVTSSMHLYSNRSWATTNHNVLTRSFRVRLFFVRWPLLHTITYNVIFEQLSDVDYKPLDPSMLRLPAPQPPSERLLAAVEAFYSPPSHERPRNRLVWVVNNFVIGWNNLAPIFQAVRERPRFHGQRCPCQVCPLGKRVLVGSILETVPNPYQRDGEEIKQHIYGKRFSIDCLHRCSTYFS